MPLLRTRGLETMSCDVGEVTDRLKNELCYDYNYELYSFSNLSVTSPTSQLILQPFRRFTYVTVHYLTLPLLHLRHSSFSSPSFASPTSHALHLRHLASRPCYRVIPYKGDSQLFTDGKYKLNKHKSSNTCLTAN